MAGLKKGDFLLEINNEDVSSASHEHVVDLIRKSGNLVQMTVVSIEPEAAGGIPMSKSTFLPGGNVDVPISRQYATLPRKVGGNQVLNRSLQAPLPPRRDPKTTLSVGRARAKSMVAGLGKYFNITLILVLHFFLGLLFPFAGGIQFNIYFGSLFMCLHHFSCFSPNSSTIFCFTSIISRFFFF